MTQHVMIRISFYQAIKYFECFFSNSFCNNILSINFRLNVFLSKKHQILVKTCFFMHAKSFATTHKNIISCFVFLSKIIATQIILAITPPSTNTTPAPAPHTLLAIFFFFFFFFV